MTQIQKYAGGMNLKVALRTSEYGFPRPTIDLRAPKGTPTRIVNAVLHQIAAAVEMATPERERWVVRADIYENRVDLELAVADAAEADRGLAVLVQVAKAAR
jgi:hypothetical protein